MQSSRLHTVVWILGLTVLFYMVNLGAMLLPYSRVDGLIVDWGEHEGIRKRTLDASSRFLASGFVTAQAGCVVTWFVLSNLRMWKRLPLFLTFLLQISIACGIGQTFYSRTNLEADGYVRAVVAWMASVVATACFTSIALQLAQRRVEFIEVARSTEGYRWSGVTTVQAAYMTALIAVALASYAHLVDIPTSSPEAQHQNWMASAIWTIASSGITSLFLFVGLSVAMYLDSLRMQIVVGVLVTEFLSYPCWLAFAHSANQWVHVLIWCLGLVVLPILWLAVVRRMGYVLRCFDRRTVILAEHNPFEEANT